MPLYFMPPKPPREGPSIRKSSRLQDFWNRLVSSIGPTEPDPTTLVQPTPIGGVLAPLTQGRIAEIKRIVAPLLVNLEDLYYAQFGRDFGIRQSRRITDATMLALSKATRGVPLSDLKKIKSVNLNFAAPPPNVAGYITKRRPDQIYYTPAGFNLDIVAQRPVPTAKHVAQRILDFPSRSSLGYLQGMREGSGSWPGAVVTHELGHTLSPSRVLGRPKGETLADFYSLLTAGLDPSTDRKLRSVQDAFAAIDALRPQRLDEFLRNIPQRMRKP